MQNTMNSQEHVKTRVLILSDTHSALPDPVNRPDYPFSQPLPVADVAIHAGDLTSTGKVEEHQRALKLLKSLPAPIKIVIPGNHDLTLDREYCARHPLLHGWNRSHTIEDIDTAHALYEDNEAVQAGIFYYSSGTHNFILPNGAKLSVYVNGWTPEFCDWAFAYPRTHDPFAHCDSDNEASIMITHGPPMGILDKTTSGEHVGCQHLRQAVERVRPILSCFGHIHESWGSVRRVWNPNASKSTAKSLGEILQNREESLEASKDTYIADEVKDESTGGDTKLPEDLKSFAVSYVDATSVKHSIETVFINASIMDVHYRPCQKPWVVDLMLPAATEQARTDRYLRKNFLCEE